MKIICHRANLDGPSSNENKCEYIDKCIEYFFDVEVDLWSLDNSLYLGHDEPQYKVDLEFLASRNNSLWIHCKNLNALNFLSSSDISFNYFWHQNDDYTLTSKGFIWAYPGKKLTKQSICVMPEWDNPNFEKPIEFENMLGICTDYPHRVSQLFKNYEKTTLHQL